MRVFEYTNKGIREENQDYIIHGFLPDDSAVFLWQMVWEDTQMVLLHQKWYLMQF